MMEIMETKRPGGRRPGTTRTRDAIIDAAVGSFVEKGYTGTTIRGVARTAGVDPALVIHFFGNKDGLFDAFIQEGGLPLRRLKEAIDGDVERLGERLVRTYLSLWEEPESGAKLRAILLTAESSPVAAEMLKAFLTQEILHPLAKRLGADHPEARAILAGSHLIGVALLRYVLRIEAMTALTTDQVIACVAPSLQRYLTGELPLGTG
jgi:AcrR family transcriptional regulator